MFYTGQFYLIMSCDNFIKKGFITLLLFFFFFFFFLGGRERGVVAKEIIDTQWS